MKRMIYGASGFLVIFSLLFFSALVTKDIENASRGPGGWGSLAYAQEVTDEHEDGSIYKFKVETLHRAARISWKVKAENAGPMTFEIQRAMGSPEGEYAVVCSVEWREGERKYKYVDKELPVEENYFYKVVVPETGESFGPIQVRPPFSLPTT